MGLHLGGELRLQQSLGVVGLLHPSCTFLGVTVVQLPSTGHPGVPPNFSTSLESLMSVRSLLIGLKVSRLYRHPFDLFGHLIVLFCPGIVSR